MQGDHGLNRGPSPSQVKHLLPSSLSKSKYSDATVPSNFESLISRFMGTFKTCDCMNRSKFKYLSPVKV